MAPTLRSNAGDFSDVEFDVALSSTLLNNRLLLNGNFGYRDKMLNNNQFVGDFDIDKFIAFCGGAHVVRRIESVEGEKIYYLPVHHLFGRDYAVDFSLDIGRQSRKLQVKIDVGVHQRSVDLQQQRGDYNFTLQDIIIKNFAIVDGSSVAFTGNLDKTQLDIDAIYALKANLSDLDESFLNDKEVGRNRRCRMSRSRWHGPNRRP